MYYNILLQDAKTLNKIISIRLAMFVYRQSDKNRLVVEEQTKRLRRFTELEKEKARLAKEADESAKQAESIPEVGENSEKNAHLAQPV